MLDTLFSGVSTIIINNYLRILLIWNLELLLFSHFLLPKLTIIYLIWSWELILWFENLMCLLIWDICDDSFLSLITKNNNDTCHSIPFDLFNNKSQIIFLLWCTIRFTVSCSDPEDISSWLFYGKMVHNIYGSNVYHNSYIWH